MPKNFSSRFNDDTAESLTISQILWIVFTVVAVMAVGTIIMKAITDKGKAVGECINNSNNLFGGTADPKCGGSTTTTPKP